MIGRRRKRALWWVAIVLPGFLLRSLIPVGFMPMFGPGLHLSLMLCPGYAPVPSARVQMSMDMSMEMDMPMAGGVAQQDPRDHQEHNSACPYGAGPTLAATTLWVISLRASPRSADPLDSTPQVTTFALPPRAQSPRGPPLEV